MSSNVRIYLAGDFARRDELAAVGESLSLWPGIAITSSWLTTPPVFPEGAGMQAAEYDAETEEKVKGICRLDLDDIDDSNLLVLFTTGQVTRGGRHFETGYAIAKGMQVVVVGPREHAFHWHKNVVVVPDVTAFLYWLSGYCSA